MTPGTDTPFDDGLADLIVAIRDDGTQYPINKLDAHIEGRLHRAVSVFITDGESLLLQQRAEGKYHSAGLWANSACSHPLWDESTSDCANRILLRELGLETPLRSIATVQYRAEVGPLIENELVDCFQGFGDRGSNINFNPDEVSDCKWVDLAALAHSLEQEPHLYAPWLRIYAQRGIIARLALG
jgi:isopentenyl-diphosphate delta-isomerase